MTSKDSIAPSLHIRALKQIKLAPPSAGSASDASEGTTVQLRFCQAGHKYGKAQGRDLVGSYSTIRSYYLILLSKFLTLSVWYGVEMDNLCIEPSHHES